MELKVLNRNKKDWIVELVGEGHSFCNVLQNFLLKDDSVDISYYKIPHPLVENPRIYVRTKGRRRPEKALHDAAKSLDKTLKAIKKQFQLSKKH